VSTVNILMDARKAGKAAYLAGLTPDANPYPYEMSAEDDLQVRKHEAWRGGYRDAEEN
jgi:hypothetical protein